MRDTSSLQQVEGNLCGSDRIPSSSKKQEVETRKGSRGVYTKVAEEE